MRRCRYLASAAALLLAAPASAALLLAGPASAASPAIRTWHGSQVHLYGAQSAGRSGAGVVVAVLDSWIDGTHPDFGGRVLPGADCTTGTCTPGQRTHDGCQHGTHVAGTVAATSYGVAPAATVLPVRVLTENRNKECTGTPAAVAAGIRWAVRQGAQVLNLSLGPEVPRPEVQGHVTAVRAAVHEAAAAGVVVVFAAGNGELPVSVDFGADALVVAATGPGGGLASYSQYGSGVTVAAPGGQPSASGSCTQLTCVTSLFPGGRYAVAAGTSMAAPHVSGLAALLIAQSPGRSRTDVVSRITTSAHPLTGAGAGRIDVGAALRLPAAARPLLVGGRVPSAPARVPAAAQPGATSRPRPGGPAGRRSHVVPRPAAPRPVELSVLGAPGRAPVPAPLGGAAALLVLAAGTAVLRASVGQLRPRVTSRSSGGARRRAARPGPAWPGRPRRLPGRRPAASAVRPGQGAGGRRPARGRPARAGAGRTSRRCW